MNSTQHQEGLSFKAEWVDGGRRGRSQPEAIYKVHISPEGARTLLLWWWLFRKSQCEAHREGAQCSGPGKRKARTGVKIPIFALLTICTRSCLWRKEWKFSWQGHQGLLSATCKEVRCAISRYVTPRSWSGVNTLLFSTSWRGVLYDTELFNETELRARKFMWIYTTMNR